MYNYVEGGPGDKVYTRSSYMCMYCIYMCPMIANDMSEHVA